MKEKIRIGCGSGFSGDRFEPAIILAKKGKLDYLVLECLAERTIALAQKRKIQDPSLGYDPFLERRITSLLPHIVNENITLVSNMGAANPLEAAKKVKDLAQKMGFKIKVAAVFGDDVFNELNLDDKTIESNIPLKEFDGLISANAYLGIEGIIEALKCKAQIIITGRVADPSLFLAPMIFEFGWSTKDYELLGKGTILGHLLECAGQVSGGYFSDPLNKQVENLENLGHPFVDVFNDGSGLISKVKGTGGMINLKTVKEQLLYEVLDPNAYITPDVCADFTTVILEEIGINQVAVKGGTGKEKPEKLKVSVGYRAFFKGEAEISYVGHNAFERAQMAGEIVQNRLKNKISELHLEYRGISAIHERKFQKVSMPYEIRLRVVGKAKSRENADLIGEEVEALYTNGPAAGGGVRKSSEEIIGIVSILKNRQDVNSKITLLES